MELVSQKKEGCLKTIKLMIHTFIHCLCGALFLAALSQIKFPFYPVPLTFQTVGLFVLALFQGGKKSAGSALFYLILATLGLPVLASEPLSSFLILSPCGGYLLAFPFIAYLTGQLLSKNQTSSILKVSGTLYLGALMILLVGTFNLCRFFSVSTSFSLGFFPFLPVEGVKVLFVSYLASLQLKKELKMKLR